MGPYKYWAHSSYPHICKNTHTHKPKKHLHNSQHKQSQNNIFLSPIARLPSDEMSYFSSETPHWHFSFKTGRNRLGSENVAVWRWQTTKNEKAIYIGYMSGYKQSFRGTLRGAGQVLVLGKKRLWAGGLPWYEWLWQHTINIYEEQVWCGEAEGVCAYDINTVRQ